MHLFGGIGEIDLEVFVQALAVTLDIVEGSLNLRAELVALLPELFVTM